MGQQGPFFTIRKQVGELHVHTTNSLDANLEGTRLTPRDAYRFAKGHPVELPKTTKTVKIARPLDFAAVTDHADVRGREVRLRQPDPHDRQAMLRLARGPAPPPLR
jgi:hypothetical protein